MIRKLSYICCFIFMSHTVLASNNLADEYPLFTGGYLLHVKNDTDAAEKYLTKAGYTLEEYKASVKEHPQDRLMNIGSYFLYVAGNPKEALEYFNQAYTFAPNSASLAAIFAYDDIPPSEKKTQGLVFHLQSYLKYIPEYCQKTEQCYITYHIPVRLAQIYQQPNTEFTDIDVSEELLAFAENILLKTKNNIHGYSLDRILHFYRCIKPDTEQYQHWQNVAHEIDEEELLTISCNQHRLAHLNFIK